MTAVTRARTSSPAGAGPPLVLLHGWAMHGGLFAPLVPRRSRSGIACTSSTCRATATRRRSRPARSTRSSRRLDARVRARARAADRARLVVRRDGRAALGARLRPRASRGSCWWARRRASSPSDDWAPAMSAATLARFGDELRVAYRLTLQRFLTLQVQGSEEGRADAGGAARTRCSRAASPHPAALAAALDVLARDRPARRRRARSPRRRCRQRRSRRADAARPRARGSRRAADARHIVDPGRRARAVPVASRRVRRGARGVPRCRLIRRFDAPDPRDVDPRAVRRAFARAARDLRRCSRAAARGGHAHGLAARLREARAGAGARRRLRHRRGGRRAARCAIPTRASSRSTSRCRWSRPRGSARASGRSLLRRLLPARRSAAVAPCVRLRRHQRAAAAAASRSTWCGATSRCSG